MALLDLLNRENFVLFDGPKFRVYHYWYNLLVDRINSISTADNELVADTISEYTADAGVTIDGVLLKDGTITTTGPAILSVDPAITATGSDDTDGYALTEELNIITGGAVNTGVELPTAVVGLAVKVANLTTTDKRVYANTGDAIDDKTVTTGYVILRPEDVVIFYCYTTAAWQSDFEAEDVYQNLTVAQVTGSDTALGIAGLAGSASVGGSVDVDGGAGNGAFKGGDVEITGGAGGAGGAGGSVDIDGGAPASGTAAGGAIEITAGAAGTTSGLGGTVDVDAGRSYGANTGGTVTINGGMGGPDQAGGTVTVAGGPGCTTNAAGGATEIQGGPGQGTGAGGSSTVRGGQGGGTDADGGDANLVGGAPQGSGTGGAVAINAGDAVAAGGLAGSISIQSGDGYLVTGGDNATDGGTVTIVSGAAGTAETGIAGDGGTLGLQGAAGGAASGAAGTGGEGSDVSITGGAGGACTDDAGGVETGGAGGDILVDSGDGGALNAASTGTAGNGGQLTVSTGNGGDADSGTGGNGGELFITAGDAGGGTTEGEAGFVAITGGGGGATNGNGGSVSLAGGAGTGTGKGGAVVVGDAYTGEVTLNADTGIHIQSPLALDLYHKCWDFDDAVDGTQLDVHQTANTVQWAPAGTSHAAANQLLQVENNGNLELTTAAAAADSEVVTNIHPVLINNNPIFEVRFKTESVTTTENVCYIGLTETANPLTNSNFEAVTDDFVLVGIDSGEANPANLRIVTDDDGDSDQTGTIEDLGVALSANVYCTVRVDCTNTEQLRVWVNNTGGVISPTDEIAAALITGTIKAGTTMYPVIFVESLDAGAGVATLTVDYFKIWHTR